MDPKYQKLGELLASLRRKAGLRDQADLAARAQVSQQTVSRWEKGTSRPQIKQIPLLAKILGAPDSDELLRLAGYTVKPAIQEQRAITAPFPVFALSPEDFERFAQDLFLKLHPGCTASRMGDRGHKQHGIDVEIVLTNHRRVTVQCKRHNSQFGPAQVRKAIKENSRPGTKNFILLSRSATPGARGVLASHPTWEIWDPETITAQVRTLSPDDRRRLVDTFFPGQRLPLLGEAESGPWQTADEFFAPFNSRESIFNHSWTLIGRANELEAITNALESTEPTVVCLHGTGGVGKTRILREAAARYEANHANSKIFFAAPGQPITAKSLDDLGTHRCLLILDDAQDREDMGILLQRMAQKPQQFRLLFSCRAYFKTKVGDHAARMGFIGERFVPVKVAPLSIANATVLAKEVLRGSDIPESEAEHIASFTYDCPLATVVGAQLVRKRKIPTVALGKEREFRQLLLTTFRNVIAGDLSTSDTEAEAIKRVLRVAALVQPFSTDSDEFTSLVQAIESLDANTIAGCLSKLIAAGVLVRRGLKLRIAPDLLGDFIITETTTPGGHLSSRYIGQVIKQASQPQLECLLMNIGKLDWRLSDMSDDNNRLLDDVWGSLEQMNLDAGFLVKAVAQVAIYQPDKALRLAEERVQKGEYSNDLARLLQNVAYHLPYVERATACLWVMGRDDERNQNQTPSHPIRLLNEFCAVAPDKPLEYNKRAVDYMLELVPKPESWTHFHNPFDVLAGIISTEGHVTIARGYQITITQFRVAVAAVHGLRDRVIDAALGQLRSDTPRVRATAAKLMAGALRYPMVGGGTEEDPRSGWDKEAEKTLLKIEAEIAKGGLHPVVLMELLRSTTWHAHYANDCTTPIAKRILKSVDQSIESRTFLVMTDPFGMILYGDDPIEKRTRAEQFNKEVSDQLVNTFSSPESLRVFLDARMQELRESESDITPYYLVLELLTRSSDFAAHLVDIAITAPQSACARFSGVALSSLLSNGDSRAADKVAALIQHGTVETLRTVADGYGGFRKASHGYTATDKSAMRVLFQSRDPNVQWAAISCLSTISGNEMNFALELLAIVNVGTSAKVADHVFQTFQMSGHGGDDKGILPSLSDQDVERILTQLLDVEELDGYWIEKFISDVSATHSRMSAKFFRERVVRALPDRYRYRAVNHGPYVHLPLKFKEAPNPAALQTEMLEWLRSDIENHRFRREAGQLFVAMFGPLTIDMVRALRAQLDMNSRAGILTMEAIVEHAPPGLVFEDSSFVIELVERIATIDRELADRLVGTLYGAAIRGSRQGVAGEPFPQDLQMRDRASEVMAGMSPLSPAFRLYQGLLENANQGIEWQRRDHIAHLGDDDMDDDFVD